MSEAVLKNGTTNDTHLPVTIANGAAVSGDIYGNNNSARRLGFRGLGVFTTGAWTAADLTIDTSHDGTAWQTERDETGAIVRAKVSALTSGGFSITFPAGPSWKAGAMPYVRLRSVNTASEANVNQGGARSLIVTLLR